MVLYIMLKTVLQQTRKKLSLNSKWEGSFSQGAKLVEIMFKMLLWDGATCKIEQKLDIYLFSLF